MLDEITPVLLTLNEAPNIGRTLSRLTWAKDIVVVDSGSTDATLSILKQYSQVRIFTRLFDTHCEQWEFATRKTKIGTSWILRLDADYQLSDEFIAELRHLDTRAPFSAYLAAFDYAIFSKKLISSLYPPNTILLKKDCFTLWDNGHTEAWKINGVVGVLKSRVVHDDWKSVEHWLKAQAHYMRRELAKISAKPRGLRDWLRLHPPLMPIAVFFYCLFIKGLILDGSAGLFYTFQRTLAEAILSLMLIEERLQTKALSKDE